MSLRKNFLFTLAGNVLYAGSQWGIIVVLAKSADPATVGLYGLAVAIYTPIILLTQLELRVVQATDALRRRSFDDYLCLRLLTSLAALVIVAVTSWVFGYSPQTSATILMLAACKTIEGISDIIYGLHQQHERMDHVARLKAARGLLSLTAMTFVILWSGSLFWGATAMAVVAGIRLFAADRRSISWTLGGNAYEGWRPRFHPKKLAGMAFQCVPLGAASTLVGLNANIPRYFIEAYSNRHNLGVFTAIAHIALAAGMVSTALVQPSIPRFARYYATGNLSAYRRLVWKLLMACILIGIASVVGATFVSQPLLAIVYSPQYAAHADVFVWIAIAVAMRLPAAFLFSSIQAMQYFRLLLCMHLTSAIVVAIFSFVLIPSFGLIGAAWAVAVTALYEAVMAMAINAILLMSRISIPARPLARLLRACRLLF